MRFNRVLTEKSNYPIHTNLPSAKSQPTPSAIQQLNQNHVSTLKPGDARRMRTNEEKTWDKKGSVIAPNDCPHTYNILNEKGNLIIINCYHLFQQMKNSL